MDTRNPYTIEREIAQRKRAAFKFIKELNHRVGALNLMHGQHRYNLTHGSEIERQRANTILPKLNTLIGVYENRIRLTKSELAGYKVIKHLDPNAIDFDEEYRTFLGQEPQQASPGSEN